ncbi:hypothetical protein BCR43DRAFT_73790 [Syncephalastrum racemosum]|uniref:Uncharacterized protein n=1 Tax=Syncephalastrum racemosum TaxID=13706 RepID=A0A1X2H254_SYNRA|nr:hypothetical protein BCR43DRAFT_73790 [Syncephalastrum racemosum]
MFSLAKVWVGWACARGLNGFIGQDLQLYLVWACPFDLGYSVSSESKARQRIKISLTYSATSRARQCKNLQFGC